MAVAGLLGDVVNNGKNEAVQVSSFCGSGKYVGLYFSAHWCPPCRQFTPSLVKFYNNMKAGPNAANFEIVFISSDRDEAAFKEYFGEMPWLTLPYEDRDRKDSISAKFGVRGIPTFVILNAETGEVVKANARSEVMDDPEGADFPWV